MRTNKHGIISAMVFAFILFFGIITLAAEVVVDRKNNQGTPVDLTQDQLIKKSNLELLKLNEEINKIKVELEKLQQEANKLQIENNTPDKNFRWLTIWFTALGGVFLGIIGIFLNSTLNRTQKEKTEQEKKLASEKHLLDLFRELGSGEPRIRVGAAAILIQRIVKIQSEKNSKEVSESGRFKEVTIFIKLIVILVKLIKKIKSKIFAKDICESDRSDETRMIVKVLLAETKHEEKVEIQKYIADGIANALDAFREPIVGKKRESPLKEYDFQGTKLHIAWWKGIDAREVDFYGASLVRVSLREAFLSGAVFKKADLSNSILEEADLGGAILQKAILKNANLRKANLKGADLRDVDLTNTVLDGANFIGAIFNSGTKLLDAQLKTANFDQNVTETVTVVKD